MSTAEPLAWRTSTRSSNGEACVEVAPAAAGVTIRHSKRPADGTITFSRSAWAEFLRESLGRPAGANGAAVIRRLGADTLVRSVRDDVELRFDHDEWSAFLAGAASDEFDFRTEAAPAH